MKDEWNIKIPNPINWLIFRRRYKRAVKKWNKDKEYIDQAIQRGLTKDSNSQFKWNQLVWQEIRTCAKIGKHVSVNRWEKISKKRGFDWEMKGYLRIMIIYIGLGKLLKFL